MDDFFTQSVIEREGVIDRKIDAPRAAVQLAGLVEALGKCAERRLGLSVETLAVEIAAVASALFSRQREEHLVRAGLLHDERRSRASAAAG